MGTVKALLSGLLGILVLAGIVMGVIRWSETEGGDPLYLAWLIIDGIAQFTVFLIPNIITLLTRVVSG